LHLLKDFGLLAILNALGNVMILTVLQFVIQFANPLNAILHAQSQKMLFAMLNVKSQNVKLNAQIKDVKCLIAQNVLQYAKLLTVLLIVKHQNPNAKQFVKNQNVIGNVINQIAQNQNVN
jgi:hypothetical protein